jgi:SAM-dependent methyltransferase
MRDEVSAWNSAASGYAQWVSGENVVGNAFAEASCNGVLDLLGCVSGSSVLDLGCGDGFLTNRLLERGASVVAIDASPRMLILATAGHSDGNVIFLKADLCESWPVASGRADAVVSNMVFMDLPCMKFVIGEAFRTVKPGGRFVFSVAHPCFTGRSEREDYPYTVERRSVKRLAGFRSDVEFLHYHRPASLYVNATINAGFGLKELSETRIADIDGLAELAPYRNLSNSFVVSALKPLYDLNELCPMPEGELPA